MEDPLANVVPAPASNPFLSLPIDILVEVTKSLRFRDLIALSLSTKGLQYLRPKRPENKRELRCFLRIHRQFLSNEYVPQSQHKSTQRKPQLIPPANCPYCQHRLCPPTCETALFLDSDSGFFFPKHLFPTHLAKFKYGRKYASYIKGLEDSYPSQKRSGQTYFYSTIWCEHHRCPRDMLSKSKYYNPENDLGVPLFLKEYYHWRQTKLVSQEVGIGYWVHDRWKVGYRLPPGVQDPKAIKEDDLIPIHEKFFYDSMCLHCLSELPFDSSPGYWRQAQFLAYRCLSPAGYRGDEKQRMYPVRPQEDAKFLDIIRGRGYGMIPLSPPRAGIQDLPYKVLRQILGYLAQETDPEDEYIFALRASYCFIKCWYGSEAMARIVQNITEPYYVQAYQLLQYSYTFETRENYILGQKDHKARKLTLEAHRQYFQNHR
ncbi:hypothetical protein TWF594_005306 [Orbilia oligospora]|nr:hypothetical protein TWF706_009422 [Orbilia oligospora]KAF3142915.1 hypothetical protein TWF594_005306 [Orbilia oligospora]